MHAFLEDFLVKDSKSDKLYHHGYHRIYPWFLAHFRDKKVDLLEIGIDETDSLHLWKGYFEDVSIHGIDINEKQFADPSVKLYKVDQSKAAELEKFVQSVGTEFDIIVDDGSHIPAHQILTLKHLWPLLKPGGVYIVEDIETSYWGKSGLYGYRFNSNRSGSNFINFSKQFIDAVNAEFRNKTAANAHSQGLAEEIEVVAYAYNSVVLIKKDRESFGKYYNREYRLKKRINSHRIDRLIAELLRRFRKNP